MRYLLAIWMITGLFLPADGQDKQLLRLMREADEFFEYEKYTTAMSVYEEANALDPANAEISFKLAECYRLVFRYADAGTYYHKTTMLSGEKEPLAFYYLGLMQKYTGEYQESIKSFDHFLDITDGTGRYPDFTEQAFIEQAGARNAMEENTASPYTAEGIPEPVNSVFNDFASAHIQDGVIVTSGRTEGKKQVDARYGEAFTDLYLFRNAESGWSDRTREEIRNLNDKYNDGSGSFSRDMNRFYYTVCGQERAECMVYVTRRKGNEWSDPEPLNDNINRPGSDAKQPVISSTGDSLFFVSNRPGGYGENDIWMSIRSSGDDWGPAANLGPSVNTRLNEVSPRTTALPNILMFASNGHQGYGGYDLFMARRLSSGDTSLINIGEPFNTSRDELYPELFGEFFYWSSNRPDAIGGFDIFESQTGTAIKFLSRLSLLNRSAKRSDVDLNSRKPSGQRDDLFTLVMEDKLEYDQLSRDEQQLIDRIVRGDETDTALEGLPAGRQNALLSLAERRRKLLENAKRKLAAETLPEASDVEAYDIEGNVVAADGAVLSDIRLYLKNGKEEIIMISGVAGNGKFKYSHIAPGQDIHITADPFIYSQVDQLAIDGLTITPISVAAKEARNIYFDLDKHTIRPEAEKYLEHLAAQLSQNPGAQIEIFAYADNSGSVAYNMALTRKRGQAVYDFLVGQGIQGNQLMIRPQGQEFPASMDQSPLGRQRSRRVEFVMHGMTRFSDDGSKTCFTTRKINLEDLADLTGLQESEFADLNGIQPLEFRAFQPVRLPEGMSDDSLLTCPEE